MKTSVEEGSIAMVGSVRCHVPVGFPAQMEVSVTSTFVRASVLMVSYMAMKKESLYCHKFK